jgi:hypothetical protein
VYRTDYELVVTRVNLFNQSSSAHIACWFAPTRRTFPCLGPLSADSGRRRAAGREARCFPAAQPSPRQRRARPRTLRLRSAAGLTGWMRGACRAGRVDPEDPNSVAIKYVLSELDRFVRLPPPPPLPARAVALHRVRSHQPTLPTPLPLPDPS